MATTSVPFVPAMPMFDANGNLTVTWRLFFQSFLSGGTAGIGATALITQVVQLAAGELAVASPTAPVPGGLALIVMLKQDTAGGRQPVWDAVYAGQPAVLRATLGQTYSSFLFIADTDESDNPVWRHMAVLNEGVPLT